MQGNSWPVGSTLLGIGRIRNFVHCMKAIFARFMGVSILAKAVDEDPRGAILSALSCETCIYPAFSLELAALKMYHTVQ